MAKEVGKIGNGSGPHACSGVTCLTPTHVHIRIAFSPYITAEVCLTQVLLSQIDNNEKGIGKVCLAVVGSLY